MNTPGRCKTHPRYQGGFKPHAGCAPCLALYTARHPKCLCGCGGVIENDRRNSKYATKECPARHRAQQLLNGPLEESFEIDGDKARITRLVDHDVRTLPDLIRICQIDTTVWHVKRFKCKSSQQFSVPRATREAADEKWVRPSSKPVRAQMFHLSAELERIGVVENTVKLIAEQLIADIRAEVKLARVPRTPRRFVDGDFLFEFTPFDLHMGKYAWDEETVTNYDVDQAEDLFNAALDYLLDQALKLSGGKLSKVLCVFGNDVAHIDSKRGETTAGTRMDVDTRYARVYRRICAIHRRAVDILREVAPVDIKIVPGNHDELTSFHLGELLEARYEDVPHVSVDNSARLRKYYEFGRNLLGFTHGDSEKVSELPLTMAREMPDAWARCTEREFHIGHLHIKEEWASRQLKPVDQDGYAIKGVRVRRLSSLSAHDFWHTKHAYMDRRACDSFLFHRDAGFTSALSFNVDHFTGKAL